MSSIIISTDMEGLTGVCRWSQVDPNGGDQYAQGCAALRHDLGIVLDILSQSPHRLIVVDGHWTGTNLRPDDVKGAFLTSGTKMPWGAIEGVQHDDAVGVLLLGYHGRAGSRGAMAHTWDTVFTEVLFDDAPCGEATLAARVAAQCGVPIIGVSGDDHACLEAKSLGDIPTAEVKRSLSHESALFYPDADDRLRQMAQASLLKTGRIPPQTERHKIQAAFMDHVAVDRAGLLPKSQRLASHTLSFEGSAKECFDALRVWSLLASH